MTFGDYARSELPARSEFSHVTRLLSSRAPKPIPSIFWLISVSVSSSRDTSPIRSVTRSTKALYGTLLKLYIELY